jgi:hypothetical protein
MYSRKRRVRIKTVVIVLTLLWIGDAVTAVYYNWSVGRDTSAWLNRAQVASNPSDMQEYLTYCRNGMEKWRVTRGYGELIFKTPENDMVLIMKALDRSIERCEYVKEFDRTSVEYQVALDDLRGQLRELDLYTPNSWFVQHGLLMAIFAWLGWIPAIWLFIL